jgi:hypothetical protein
MNLRTMDSYSSDYRTLFHFRTNEPRGIGNYCVRTIEPSDYNEPSDYRSNLRTNGYRPLISLENRYGSNLGFLEARPYPNQTKLELPRHLYTTPTTTTVRYGDTLFKLLFIF